MVDLVGNILFAVALGWTVAATATDYLFSQSRPMEGGNMRNTAHAERRFWGVDNPDLRHDFRGRLGVVLPMDSQALEGPSRQAGNQARRAVQAVSKHRVEGPLGWLLAHVSIARRCDALEAQMDGMAEWLEARNV